MAQLMVYLENVPCVLEKSVYSVVVGGTFFTCQLEGSRCWTSISVLCFLVDLLPRSVRHTSVVLKSPASIVELFVSPVSTVRVCFLYFGTPFLGEDFLEETREHSCYIIRFQDLIQF